MPKRKSRLIHALFLPAHQSYCESCWRPAVDIYKGRDVWALKFDLAGVHPDDVELSVEGRRVTIRGVRRDWNVIDGQQSYSMEIEYSRFERTIELPCDLERVEVKLDYREGMYLVFLKTGSCES